MDVKLKELLENNESKNKIKNILDSLHPYDISNEINELDDILIIRLFDILGEEKSAEVISYLESDLAYKLLKRFEVSKQKVFLDEMTTDDAVDILQEYTEEERKNIILDLEDKEDIVSYLKYKDDQVGAYMNSEYVSLLKGVDVKKAVKSLIKQAPDAETINYLFVVDKDNNYEGTINLKDLVRARSPKKIEEIITKHPSLLDVYDIEKAAIDMKNYNVFAMPVIDKDGKLKGILTVDDVMDIAAQEAREDFGKFAAVENTEERKIIKDGILRLPWLLILLLLSVPISLLTGSIGAQVMTIGLIAIYQPLTLDTPGNIATQTLIVSLRAINKNGKVSLKETRTEFLSGVLTGLSLGIVVFLVTFLVTTIKMPNLPASFNVITNLEKKLLFSGILSISVFLSSALAPLVAILFPSLCHLLKIDPAVASGPFITTIIDVCSVLIYVGTSLLLINLAGVVL